MNGWLTFWAVSFAVIVAVYFLIAIILVPLGARDLLRLFRRLNQDAVTRRGGDSDHAGTTRTDPRE